MVVRGCAAFSLFVSALLLVRGDDPPAPSEKELRDLVSQLVSPNPAPPKGDGKNEFRAPAGYDRQKQEKVHAAYRKLQEIGPSAFPFVIELVDEERFCLTTSYAVEVNVSVGEVCKNIIGGQLQPYGSYSEGEGDARSRPRRPSYPDSVVLSSKKSAEEWWRTNKHKSLNQMQLEVIDWVIAEETKRPKEFTDRERAKLQQIRRELMTGKPLPSGSGFSVELPRGK